MDDPRRLWDQARVIVFIDRVHGKPILLIELYSALISGPDVEFELSHIAELLEVLDHPVQKHGAYPKPPVGLENGNRHEVHSVHPRLVLGLISAKNAATQNVSAVIGKNAQVLPVRTEKVLSKQQNKK